MAFEDSIRSIIDGLPTGQKAVGRYFLAHLEESSYSTLAAISRRVGISQTTIIRFAYSLGYDSFTEMQKALRNELLGNNSHDDKAEPQANIYLDILENEIAILKRTKDRLNLRDIDYAAEKLYRADRIVSIASQVTAPAAIWFGNIAGKYRENVRTVTAIDLNYYSELATLTSNSVVVAVTFSRYAKPTSSFLRLAKARGATTIVITDNLQEIATAYADIRFITDSNRDETAVNTISSATAVLNLLAAALYRKDPAKARIRLNELEYQFQQSNGAVFD